MVNSREVFVNTHVVHFRAVFRDFNVTCVSARNRGAANGGGVGDTPLTQEVSSLFEPSGHCWTGLP